MAASRGPELWYQQQYLESAQALAAAALMRAGCALDPIVRFYSVPCDASGGWLSQSDDPDASILDGLVADVTVREAAHRSRRTGLVAFMRDPGNVAAFQILRKRLEAQDAQTGTKGSANQEL